MKQLLYSLHSAWSLLSALLSLRLREFEEWLRRAHAADWGFSLGLPSNDALGFYPYIISVGGIRRKRTVKDPVNIVACGVTPREFIALLRDANPKWHQFLGSSYFLHGSDPHKWHASIAIKLDIDAQACERHHVRLFGLTTKNGQNITLGAAHRDWPNHTEQGAPASWNETRDFLAEDLKHLLPALTDPVTEINWRGAASDGKILIVNCTQ